MRPEPSNGPVSGFESIGRIPYNPMLQKIHVRWKLPSKAIQLRPKRKCTLMQKRRSTRLLRDLSCSIMRKGKPGAEGSAHQSHSMFGGRNGIASTTYQSLETNIYMGWYPQFHRFIIMVPIDCRFYGYHSIPHFHAHIWSGLVHALSPRSRWGLPYIICPRDATCVSVGRRLEALRIFSGLGSATLWLVMRCS